MNHDFKLIIHQNKWLLLMASIVLLLFLKMKLLEMMRGFGIGVKEFKKGVTDVPESIKLKKRYMIRLYMLVVLLLWIGATSNAQTHMRIHHKDGVQSNVPLAQIDSITFANEANTSDYELGLMGSWLWGDVEVGYYELLTFNDDKTYMGYDNYFTYGFDTITYGWYMQVGNMLTLQSNGYGYNRRYNWFVLGLTDNAIDVMTKMGRYVYYKLQSEVLHLRAGDEHLTSPDGEHFVFADGVVARIIDGKLQGIWRLVITLCLRNKNYTFAV